MHISALLLVVFGLPAFADLINTQFPKLLLPLKESQPDIAFITQNDATASYNSKTGDEQWTAVNFDVPVNNAKTCRLRFLINVDPFKNAPLTLKGEAPFAISISRIQPTLVNGRTNWNNKPAIIEHYDSYVLTANGASEVVSKWFECPMNKVAQFVIHPASKRDLELYWFELNYGATDGGPHGVVLEMHT
ncbi:ubiquitin 3 binding protein But2 C-terminal domain-containing protein [Alternaria rosae]|uniref:ubiquitin 3 binding protein But2 C-terminal domain-containing protein n=1 Tax=Alternaria rosae TaxID=1187941 RepID=UPI001E8E1831|nr:ubiquitin 3 binding protein But2 C-terminal domain-containing protein [Alternaria rosae]KAH6881895.1 ubiquitin 3 binding protein But2 C-terminal domain-containing protein [Alternaria rosae]